MSTNGWLILVGAALVLGVAIGGWSALRVATMRFDQQLKRATEDLKQRNAAMADQLRSAQTRSQADLDQARNSFKRQLAVMAAEPNAALERSEKSLKAAYAELDRLRGKVAADTGPSELGDGFAATRPMHNGM